MKLNNIHNAVFATAALFTMGLSSSAYADSGFYLGGAISQAYVDETGIDDDDTGGKIYGGYKFNDFFAIEANYYDFGEIEDATSELELDGFGIAAVGIIPVSENISLFGKVGIHEWDADAVGSAAALAGDDDGNDAFYGIGIEYDFSERWSVRGEIERYEVEDLDVDVASIGISFRF